MENKWILKKRQHYFLDAILILITSCYTLLFSLPYKSNIFLAYDGAYRLYMGQVPFVDYMLPLGYGMWLIPAAFFFIFGPYMYTLVIAQVFINIISGFTFRGILSVFNVQPWVKTLSVLILCVSYIFINRWPWYNHMVIVFEFLSIFFVVSALLDASNKINRKTIFFILSGLTAFLSFFTKQDGGAFCIMIVGVLLLTNALYDKKFYWGILFFGLGCVLGVLIFIAPVYSAEFKYWFNLGQVPHYSRVSIKDIINEIFNESMWLKLYTIAVLLFMANKLKHGVAEFVKDKRYVFFLVMTLGILGQAFVLQVTSYTPALGNIYFHSFAFAFLVNGLFYKETHISWIQMAFYSICIMLFWSGSYWQYFKGPLLKLIPEKKIEGRQVISKNNFLIKGNEDESAQDENLNYKLWKESSIKSFKRIKLPPDTEKGMQQLLNNELISKPDLRLLNMTELTPLANEIGYELEQGKPLWYHYGVSIFDKELEIYTEDIENHIYDIVLYEYKPMSNNFYPFKTREDLEKNYILVDTMPVPRKQMMDSQIEVYVPERNLHYFR